MRTGVNGPAQSKTRLSANGRIVIPAEIREELGFKPGDTLYMDVDDGGLRLETYSTRIRRIQEALAPYLKPGVLASDELIAERRAEVLREEAEFQREMAEQRLRAEGKIA